MTTPITTPTPLATPDPSPTVLALAQALATYDGFGWVFTSTTKSETSAEIASKYIQEAESIAVHLPAPTVKPGRDEVLEAVLGARWPSGDRIDGVTVRTAAFLADAVLAILPGKSEQEVITEFLKTRHTPTIKIEAAPGAVALIRAQALRDAKARVALDFTFSGHEVAAWLDALADEEAGK